jgi:hypothetical protein
MEFSSGFLGFILISLGCAGCVLISSALSFPLTGLIGLLFVVVPICYSLWYLMVRIQQLEEVTKSSGRQIRRSVDEHASTMAHRYDATIGQMADMNNELLMRVYR